MNFVGVFQSVISLNTAAFALLYKFELLINTVSIGSAVLVNV